MIERKRGYLSPEIQLILCSEDDFIRTSGGGVTGGGNGVDWEKEWGIIPDNPFKEN